MSDNIPSEPQITPSQNVSRPWQQKSWLAGSMLVILLTLIAFGRSVMMDFVGWDDNIHIYENPFFQPVTWDHVWHFWHAPYEKFYVPISYTMFAGLAILARLSAPDTNLTETGTLLNPHTFHIANLVVHLINTFLVFAILGRLTKNATAATIGSLIFGVHPIQVESVAWISEMRGLLSGFFSLLCLWVYLQSNQRRYYIAALLCALAALLCKPSAVTLPFVLMALDHWSLGRSWRDSMRRVLPFIAIALPFIAISHAVQPVPDSVHTPLWTRPLIVGDALVFYVAKVIAPLQFAIDYGRTPESVLAHPWIYFVWLVPLAAVGLLWRYRRQVPWLVLGSVIFVAFLLPELGFVPFLFQTHSTVADRYAYLAMLGPALIVANLLLRLRLPAILISVIIVLGLTAITTVQTQHWTNSEALFSHAVAINPNSAISQYNYGKLLEKHEQIDAAIDHYRIALRNQPTYPDAHVALGADLQKQGNLQGAITEYQAAISEDPTSDIPHYNLGTALSAANQSQAAIAEFEQALRLNPNSILPHLDLGVELATMGDLKGAIAQFQEVVTRDPTNTAAANDLEQALNMLNAQKKPKQ